MKKLLFALFILPLCCSAKFNIPETPFNEYVFSAKECTLIHHHESRIFIEPNTFYLEGKLYEGEVHLKYREFMDQLDIILNDIPMSYNENNKHHVLESGGMFELYAYGNGQLLSFAPGKKARVQLGGKFDPAGGETFIFNKKTKNWEKMTP
ncbi:MAG: high-affnity carbon uptake protein Hat/HatR, partial [Bacteroidota bacterium]|nr:high-affnity carbon uptake protein Hat/HatR [Bacteroidota bacterium]